MCTPSADRRRGEIRRVAAVDEHELVAREGVTEVQRVQHREVGTLA
jgi:hypothetical protein